MIDTFSNLLDTFSNFIGPSFDPPLTSKKRKLKTMKRPYKQCACRKPDCYIIPSDRARNSMEVHGKQYSMLCGYGRLCREVDMLKKVLEFYSNPENWKLNESNYRELSISNCAADSGKLATDILNRVNQSGSFSYEWINIMATKKERIAYLMDKIFEAKIAYYNKQPIVSDKVFDAWIDELKELDPTNKILKTVGAPLPSTTEWKKASHSIPMGSLDKVNTPKELIAWVKEFGSK